MSQKKLRVFIFTQNEPFYIPKVIKHVLDRQGETYEVIGASVLSPKRKNKSIFHWFFERSRIYTAFELSLAGLAFGVCKLHSMVSQNGKYAVKALLNRYNVPILTTNDVNDPAFVAIVDAEAVDVILSISPPQIFKAGLLSTPKRYALNAHGTLLPRHRGVFGSWWTLYCGDQEAGSTIHTMALELDAGENVWQKSVPVEPNDTQYSIAYNTKKLLAEGLVVTLDRIYSGDIDTLDKNYEPSYHRAPTQAEGREFHRKGYKVLVWRDLNLMLSNEFNLPK